MVERSLSMREVQGSIPCISTLCPSRHKQAPEGFEPSTLRLLGVRSNQLSYESVK